MVFSHSIYVYTCILTGLTGYTRMETLTRVLERIPPNRALLCIKERQNECLVHQPNYLNFSFYSHPRESLTSSDVSRQKDDSARDISSNCSLCYMLKIEPRLDTERAKRLSYSVMRFGSFESRKKVYVRGYMRFMPITCCGLSPYKHVSLRNSMQTRLQAQLSYCYVFTIVITFQDRSISFFKS